MLPKTPPVVLLWLVVLIAVVYPNLVWSQNASADSVDAVGLPGTVLVLPFENAPMPDMSDIVTRLRTSGYTAPGNSTEFRDGREILKSLGTSVMLVSPDPTITCDNDARAKALLTNDSRKYEPAAAVAEAERALVRTKWSDALKYLEQARRFLPCQTEPVQRDVLYRLYFLMAIAHHHASQELRSTNRMDSRETAIQTHLRDAERFFAIAWSIFPNREWDRNYSPDAYQIFLQARDHRSMMPDVTFQQQLTRLDAEVWLNGVRLNTPSEKGEPVSAKPGEHLVQVTVPGNVTRPTAHHGWILQSSPESSHDIIWITDSQKINQVDPLFNDAVPDGSADLLVDLFVRWARLQHRQWLVIMRPANTGSGAEVIFVDVAARKIASAPNWLLLPTSSLGPPLAVLPLVVPEPLQGWRMAVGLELRQSLGTTRTSFFGLELDGTRTIQGMNDARINVSFGAVPDPPSGAPRLYQTLHVGARHRWEANRLGLHVGGGFFGCHCIGSYTAGLDVRFGTYYQLDKQGRNAIHLASGLATLPRERMILGSAEAQYQWAF